MAVRMPTSSHRVVHFAEQVPRMMKAGITEQSPENAGNPAGPFA
jgi:hypothetical protein